MKKLFLFSITLAFPIFVFAAGVGGGGSALPEKQVKEEPRVAEENLPPIRTHWCYTLPLLKQRVECRLGLSEKDLAAEYARQYLPEECRALPKKQQSDCVERYKALTPCWEKVLGEERTACAREALAIPENLSDARKECTSRPKKEQARCLATLRQGIDHLVKFRFYDLNERVEDFLRENPTVDGRPGMQFLVASELYKQRMNAARTKAQRLQIIRQERAAWKKFVSVMKPGDVRDFLDDAIEDLSVVE